MNLQSAFIELPSTPMQKIYSTIQKVVGSNIPFFITGETGVGKEGIARYIHEKGKRRDKPFIAINCGRFSAELLQSELFGHEAGAFTSAIRQRQGAFEIANGGVLFLDEVPEMSLDAQKMLLSVLDTATFTRLGGIDLNSETSQTFTRSSFRRLSLFGRHSHLKRDTQFGKHSHLKHSIQLCMNSQRGPLNRSRVSRLLISRESGRNLNLSTSVT